MKSFPRISFWLFLIASLLLSSLAWSDHASVGFGFGSASPIATESAVPLPEGKWTVGLRSESIDFDEKSDAELLREREVDPEGETDRRVVAHRF